jgi:hypothetical protein
MFRTKVATRKHAGSIRRNDGRVLPIRLLSPNWQQCDVRSEAPRNPVISSAHELEATCAIGSVHGNSRALSRRVDMDMNAKAIYEGFIRFEERSSELYLELSVRFHDRPDLSWFWVEMAMEEKQHAGLLHHCRDAGVFSAELPGKEQMKRLDSLFRRLETRVAAPGITMNDAFDIAIKLESSEINDVYSKLTAPIDGPAHIVRKRIELSIGGHFQRLQRAARTFNASADIRERIDELSSSAGSPR